MLKTILSVSGRPGLFKLVSKGKNMFIVESLIDKQRIPMYAKDKAVPLADITVYTDGENEPLPVVLTQIRDKENSEKISLNLSAAKPDELRAYLATVLPHFDRERVYPNDIRKILSWYNLLITSGITDFTPEEKPQQEEPSEEE
ncbi:MAG: DUF5606 domain-containing protein [Tannerellaceae bacterium]|jgi:hypothetical protein|nr:DUF5606 domain-containing protein [Tannerellaceae bacterium]